MTAITPAPFSLKDATLKLGATDQFESGITGALFTPTTSVSTVTAISGATYAASGVTTWVAAIDFLQDYETAGSLSNYLLTNNGSVVTAAFYPIAGGNGYTMSVLIVPSTLGAANSNGPVASSVSLSVVGQPTLIGD